MHISGKKPSPSHAICKPDQENTRDFGRNVPILCIASPFACGNMNHERPGVLSDTGDQGVAVDTTTGAAGWPKDKLFATPAPSCAAFTRAESPRATVFGGMPYASKSPDTTYPARPRNAAVPWPGRAKLRLEPRPITPPPAGDDGACINSYGVTGLLGERQMNTSIRNFLKEEDGITALEYGVLAALVATVILAVIGTTSTGGLGTILTTLLGKVSAAVSGT